jgi:hypothetical protein
MKAEEELFILFGFALTTFCFMFMVIGIADALQLPQPPLVTSLLLL